MFQIIQKWIRRLVAEIINAKLGLVSFTINFSIVFWVNHSYGFAEAAWAGVRGGVSAFLLGGIFGRMSERFSEISNPWLAYPLGSVIPTLLAYSIIWPMHSLTGTPRPFMSTLLPMLQSMFINTPGTIFVLRRGFLRQNQNKPAVKDKIWLRQQEKRIDSEQRSGRIQRRRIAMVVPTYWVASPPALDLDHFQFDHPTISPATSTLPALLQSMKNINLEGVELMLVISADTSEAEEEARQAIEGWLDEVELPIPVHLFDSAALQDLKQELGSLWDAGLLNLHTYSGVRNCGLAMAAMLGAEIVTFIDDDEQLIDEHFFETVRRSMRLEFHKRPIDLLAGYYVYDESGTFEREDPFPAIADAWPKYPAMNRAFRHYIGRDPRLKAAAFGFGGNLSLRPALFKELHFDPQIPRGEDIDYVLMARRLQYAAVFDRDVRVLHAPPPGGAPMIQQVYQDMVRFSIQRQKLQGNSDGRPELKRLRRRELYPYPGPLISRDLPEIIARTAAALQRHCLEQGDEHAAEIAAALPGRVERALPAGGSFERWSADRQRWSAIMAAISGRTAETEEVSHG